MSRTLTLPPTDPKMWRRLLRRVHPDTGGEHELFIWAGALQEHVAGHGIEGPKHAPPRRTTNGESARVPYEFTGSFEELTRRALSVAERVPEPYARLLRLLRDCRETHYGALAREQCRGASYRRLAAIAHVAGLSHEERQGWCRVAESVPLSDRHAGFLLDGGFAPKVGVGY